MHRFSYLCGRGHDMRCESILMNWSCAYHLGTLSLNSTLATFYESINLMILDRWCDFDNGSSMYVHFRSTIF
ncbi:hypothetical protein AXX17_AT4G11910 [Arabidopsis thaliana]|uniref:Uncharacterized protein n=1 Tax=Arabidopsis thaliana TaxID=3702 RepID=A0A178V4K5_ARATH|nr:hypothetical protein AXX17_AT4G11910 [Arabidopsis thaliana]